MGTIFSGFQKFQLKETTRGEFPVRHFSGADKHENCALCEESTKFGTDVAYDGVSRFGHGATSKMTSLPFYGGLKHGTEAES